MSYTNPLIDESELDWRLSQAFEWLAAEERAEQAKPGPYRRVRPVLLLAIVWRTLAWLPAAAGWLLQSLATMAGSRPGERRRPLLRLGRMPLKSHTDRAHKESADAYRNPAA
ncbi:MAG TPA: hypothetical protein VFA70_08405 [Dehalococcoidia bacterium]|jgi:hypothetical protein|nr:hypothetical protein [Dehalococcoidia bacterium]